MAQLMGAQLAFLHVLYLIWCVLAIGKCHNRKLECPRELINTPCACKKTLEEDGLEIICENADVDQIGILLEKIPKETVIKHMRLRNNQIVQLPALKFQHLHIHHLAITRSNVQDIDAMAFFNLDRRLYSLDLSGNLLTQVPVEAIRRLTNLRTINLSSNLISRILPNAFSGMSSLLNIHLDNNEIDEVETFAFNGADNLTKVHLNHNRIKSLPGRMFSKSSGLEELQLNHNQLDSLPEGFFQGITTSLNHLQMTHNVFHKIPPEIGLLQQLETLNLNHNCLDEIANEEAFLSGDGQSQLSSLDLSSNNLSTIPVDALKVLDSVTLLNLQNNSITDIPAHAFRSLGKSLKFLYLQDNRLANISNKAFSDLEQLEWLYLARNRLASLHETAIRHVKKSLRILDIHDNPLKCDCKLKWISQTQWPKLLSREKETKCREPGTAFGQLASDWRVYPQICESAVQAEASKLKQDRGNTAEKPTCCWQFVFVSMISSLLFVGDFLLR